MQRRRRQIALAGLVGLATLLIVALGIAASGSKPSSASGTSARIAVAADLNDTFDSNTIDPSRWLVSQEGSTVAAASQQLEISHPAGSWTKGSISSAAKIDLTGHAIQVQVKRAANGGLGGSTFGETEIHVRLDSTHYAYFLIASGTLTAWVNSGSGETNLTPSWPGYSADSMQWLRFRETAGRLYWEYAGGSTSAGPWITLASTATPFDLTSLTYVITAGANVRAADTAQFDNVAEVQAVEPDPVITAAGDIASNATGSAGTAALVEQIAPTRALTLGDNNQLHGTLSEFLRFYDPNWGRFKAITSPSPGNHDYVTPGAAGYFEYFGSRAPGEYYSFDLAAWHLISLDSEIAMSAGSAQLQWLEHDLAANQRRCILAYWHRPRFSSGPYGDEADLDPLWHALYAAGASVVLNGHSHQYERFGRQNPDGVADPYGIREFVVGTGGTGLYPFESPKPNSEVRDNSTEGVLELTLHADSYDWRFVPVAGGSFTDSGSDTCTRARPVAPSTASRRALLASVLAPRGIAASISAVLKAGGYTYAFRSLSGGRIVIEWYYLPRGAILSQPQRTPKPVLIATGTARPSQAGPVMLRVGLTKAGKQMLKAAKQLRLTAKGTDTPTGGQAVSTTKPFTLVRR